MSLHNASSDRPLVNPSARSKRHAARKVLLGAIIIGAAAIMVGAIDRTNRRVEGPLKGADFVQFYTLGHLASTHRVSAMYDMKALHEAQVALVPESTAFLYPPVYPPQTSLLFA